jgi:hypothetical protein
MRVLNRLLVPCILQGKQNNMQLFSHVKDANMPVCSDCKFYTPSTFDDYLSSSSRCSKYGEKDIYTGTINYDFISSCRNDKTKCGPEGKDFELETNFIDKKLKHHVKRYSFIYFLLYFYPFSIFFANNFIK